MKYFIRKILTFITTLFLVSFFTFVSFNVLPGDPVHIILGVNAPVDKEALLREQLGLNEPLSIRYLHWIEGLFKGDLGQSIKYERPVLELLKSRVPVSFGLTLIALFFIMTISIPFGVLSARKEGKWLDHLIQILSQIQIAIPAFFLGILMMLFFGIVLKWFKPGQYISYQHDIGGFIHYMIYPAMAIALPKIGTVIKFLRGSIINQLQSDYVRTAYSKGNSERNVVYRHVLKNALIPVITLLGMIVADILAGSLVIEQVFSVPGIGRLLISSIGARDFPLLQAMVFYITAIVVSINFLVDVLYQVIDPRIRIQ